MSLLLALALQPQDGLARDRGRSRDPSTIVAIVLHSVGGPACVRDRIEFRPIPIRADDAEFWQKLLKAAPSADAHFVIGRAGHIAQVMPATEIANHAVGVNPVSVGIELVHRGDGLEPFEEPQIAKLIETIKELRRQYPGIKIENIVRHSDIDQRTCSCGGVTYRRRQDPGANFPMERVIAEVRLADEKGGATTLPRLSGQAPAAACPKER
jgi:N-acetyl-anhydromuramyl-L-alanine amidase AmpD